MRKLANLRALYGQPITVVQGVPERLETMIERYYALVAMGSPFHGDVVEFIARWCKSPMSTNHASRTLLADEVEGMGARTFDMRAVAYGIRRCKPMTWLRLIEEVEDFRARSQLGL